MRDIQLSVIIPTYNSKELLKHCLDSLEKQTASPSEFEVIVVNDGSNDGTSQMLEEFQKTSKLQFKSIHIENSGPAIARNQGTALAQSEWVAFLDADVRAHPNWIKRGLELIQKNPDAGGFEGRTEVSNRHTMTLFTHQTENIFGGRYPTCNLILRKIFCQFYPKYRIPFREDTDLVFSILEAGYQIHFDALLIVYHPPLHPSYLRLFRLATRYYYDGLLRKRFPLRYKKNLDTHSFLKLKVANLKIKVFGLFILSQTAFIVSMIISHGKTTPLTLITGGIYLSSYLYGCTLRILSTPKQSRRLSDTLVFAAQIHIIPWILHFQIMRGRFHFRNEPRFSRTQWWDQIGYPVENRPFDIILIATADWDHPFWTNKQHIASRLGQRGNRVLYIESLGLRQLTASSRDLERIYNRFRLLYQGLREVQSNVYVWSPLVIPYHQLALIRKINWIILRRMIQRYCRQLQFNQPILWSYNPIVSPLAEQLKSTKIVYHCVDELKAAPGMPAETLAVQEEIFCKKASLIFATSPRLYETRKIWNENTYYLPNPCDFEHFHKATESSTMSEDLEWVPQPRLGFIGAVSRYKVDAELLKQVAESHPEWHIVLIGQVGEGDPGSNFDQIAALPNVYFLGPKPYQELPNYLAGFQVALLPCPLNEYTQNMFPLKFFEYLAAGLPVVSTALPALKAYQDIFHWCTTSEEFIRGIEFALKKGKKEERLIQKGIELARQNTWDHRVTTMLEILNFDHAIPKLNKPLVIDLNQYKKKAVSKIS